MKNFVRLLALLACSVSQSIYAQEQPAQPPAEEDIASRFEQAVPALFEEWTGIYRQALPLLELGRETEGRCPPSRWLPSGSTVFYFEFTGCRELKAPELVSVDVRKTDSLLKPFIGSLVARVSESCTVRRIVPKGASGWTLANREKIADGCVGQKYEQCIQAGGKPAPPFAGSGCTGGPQSRFPFNDEITAIYAWSHGRWEFEREELRHPRVEPAGPTTP